MTNQPLDREGLYSEEEAAALLKMSIKMLARRRRAGKILCIKDQDYIAFTGRHILEYCAIFQKRGKMPVPTKLGIEADAQQIPMKKQTPKSNFKEDQ
jgi:hypothetical protein